MASEQYRRYAAECLVLANKTDDPIAKLTFVGLAHAWVGLAELAEKSVHTDLVYETPQKSQNGDEL